MIKPMPVLMVLAFVLSGLAALSPAQQAENQTDPVREIVESGVFADDVYNNERLGVSITVPEDWTVSEPRSEPLSKDAAKSKANSSGKGLSGRTTIFQASLPGGSIAFSVIYAPDKTSFAYSREILDSIPDSSKPIRRMGNGNYTIYAGIEFSLAYVNYLGKERASETSLVRKIDDFMLVIYVANSSEKAEMALNQSLETLKIKKKI